VADVRPAKSRVRAVSLAATVGCSVLLALFAASATAADSHAFAHYFGDAASVPKDPYPLVEPTGIAVDDSSGASAHDVYVTDPAMHRVEKFGVAGNFILMFGQEVDATTGGNLCTALSGDVCQAGAAGPSPGAFEDPAFIAVDGSSGPSSGDIYVGDTEADLVSKFDSSGNLIETWGTGGQLGGFGGVYGVTVDRAGNLFVMGALGKFQDEVFRYTQDGEAVSIFRNNELVICREGLAIDGEARFYRICGGRVSKFAETGQVIGEPANGATGIAIDPVPDDLYVDQGEEGQVRQYIECDRECEPFAEPFGSGHLTDAKGVAVDSSTEAVYVANTGAGNVAKFESVTPRVITGVASSFTPSSAKVEGLVEPVSLDEVTECYFQYGTDKSYESGTVPCEPATPISGPTNVSATLTGLQAAIPYHYRLVAESAAGRRTLGEDRTANASEAPAIDASRAEKLTTTSADLEAKINPQGSETTYHFEYGTSTSYGTSIPAPDAAVGSDEGDDVVTEHISSLKEGVVYHFRVIATNQYGATTSEDQTFTFEPPECPNASVRQQTKTTYLPDCRAYELVSAANANGTLLRSVTRNSPYADDSFVYGGSGGTIPGTGDPENGETIDTYVATRTPTGWVSKYVGIPGDEASLGAVRMTNLSGTLYAAFENLTVRSPDSAPPAVASSAPYIYTAQDELLGQWPTNLAIIPGGRLFHGSLQPSPDFSHLAFSSNNVAFTADGRTSSPGSAYDFNTTTNEVSLISKTPAGGDIPTEPGSGEEVAIDFGGHTGYNEGQQWNPPVSTDGSHILMSVQGKAGLHLYMRVNDAITYDVSKGHEVRYLGMTSDGSKVFFTSPQQLTASDHDNSRDLYMWSEATDSLTDLSLGTEPGSGNGDGCVAKEEWVEGCNVLPVQIPEYAMDSAIAAKAGDVYFYSPEKLDGTRGVAGLQNLYVYRDGADQFVKTFNPGVSCSIAVEENLCGNGPLERLEISPSGDHVAFVTNHQLTGYNNNHHSEMYTYNPASGQITCVSCEPDGTPPTSDVTGSSAGLFLAEDGRTVFFTKEPLVPQDTDKIHDVYEYVDGRPQLITSGRGVFDTVAIHDSSSETVHGAGLEAFSADGKDIFFSTFDTLVPQDENGNFLKVYDARAGGGFLDVPATPPCEAADECHGAGSQPPGPPQIGSGASLGDNGNWIAKGKKKKGKRQKHGRRHRHAHKRGGHR
jgi:hypothetical protein